MHIYIVAQYLHVVGDGEDRLLALGRKWAEKGHQVTVFTISSGSGLELGKKKIGIFEEGGILTVTFNAPYAPEMGIFAKLSSFRRFSRMVKKQGLKLPAPDLVVAVAPPISAALAALKLCQETGAGLITEVRERWPAALKERGTVRNLVLVKILNYLEERLYRKSNQVVVINEELAEEIEARFKGEVKTEVVPFSLEKEEQFKIYDKLAASLKKI